MRKKYQSDAEKGEDSPIRAKLTAAAKFVTLLKPGALMKSAVLSSLLLLSVASALGQSTSDLTTGSKQAEAVEQTTPKVKSVERPAAIVKERKITASGFLVDVAQSKEKKKLLSLRQKADAQKDHENIITDSRSGRPIGFRLFSINF